MHKSLPNTIDYVEMPSTDLTATKDFFGQLFGWSFQEYGPDYCAFDDGRMAGGFFASENTGSVAAGAPLIVFYRADLEKICDDVARFGGKNYARNFRFPRRPALSFRSARRRRIRDLVGVAATSQGPRNPGKANRCEFSCSVYNASAKARIRAPLPPS